MFMPRISPAEREKQLITEPEQKAIILFDAGTEDLIISPAYKGSADRFAWVVPVPSRPRVQILNGAIFHELKNLLTPRRPITMNRRQSAPGAAAPPRVEVLERKIVGAYDVSVLKSNDPDALNHWLKQNGYRLPQGNSYLMSRLHPVEYYVHNQWIFVACRVKIGQEAKGLQTGTLAPIRLTFKAKRPIYPLRLSALNDGGFLVNIYLLLPSDKFSWVSYDLRPVEPASVNSHGVMIEDGSIKQGQTKYPALAKLSSKSLRIFSHYSEISPADCTTDLIWPANQKEAQQVEHRRNALIHQEWLMRNPDGRHQR
jgi:hypothetical protein